MILKNISLDCVIFGFDGENLNVLLWKSKHEQAMQIFSNPDDYEMVKDVLDQNPIHQSDNYWAVIGSLLPNESAPEEQAKRITTKITGLENVYLNQVRAFGKVDRVPYFRTITIAYYALINSNYHHLKQTELAKELKWFRINQLPDLIFDHEEIIKVSREKLQEMVRYHPIGFHLLPEEFTLTQLQKVYEVILDTKLDIRNFRKKILHLGLLVDTGKKQQKVSHRAAKLFKFDKNIYDQLVKDGLNFRI